MDAEGNGTGGLPETGSDPQPEPEPQPALEPVPQPEPQPAPEPVTDPIDAGAVGDPPVTEFDLGDPRANGPGPPPGNGGLDCDAGRCVCESNFDCPASLPVCDVFTGLCAQCASIQDCAAFGFDRLVCDLGECRPCERDGECPNDGYGWQCRGGSCVETCIGNRDCSLGRFCQDGVCTSGELLPPEEAN